MAPSLSSERIVSAASVEICTQSCGTTGDLPVLFNHRTLGGGDACFDRQGEIKAPTLIIHGTDDPVVSYDHARALKRSVPNAELLALEGAGHEISEEDWPAILTACARVMS